MLTEETIRSAEASGKPYKLPDAKGLHLHVALSGAKTFRYRFELDGKEGLFVIGNFCEPRPDESADEAAMRRADGRYTLDEARAERVKARALVKMGISPVAHRNSATLPAPVAGKAQAPVEVSEATVERVRAACEALGGNPTNAAVVAYLRAPGV